MVPKRLIGFHLRLHSTLVNIVHEAQALGLNTFQCFLVHQVTKKQIVLTELEIDEFKEASKRFNKLFMHGAYWINIAASHARNAQRMLHNELSYAQKLGFTHYVLHPGAAVGWADKEAALKAFTQRLDHAIESFPDIQIVLENAAHGGMTIGGNLEEFAFIKAQSHYAQKLRFCIDTAHAYAHGYPFSTVEDLAQFVSLIEKTVGCESVSLLHINDTKEKFAHKKDKHEVPGHGHIGIEALRSFAFHPKLLSIPVIFELTAQDLMYVDTLKKDFSQR